MNAQILTFSANEQTLIKTGGIDDFASNTVRYAKATFTLGTNWTGFDSVRAVWKTACYTISTVLDANHSCDVPPEVLSYKAKVYVNLVGSISENGVLTDRLTTFPVLAMHIKSNAPVEGTETAPVTASQFEQFVEAVQDAAGSISDYSYDSEAWAVGKRGGVDVPSTDETYHNNSKYWAEQNAGLSDEVADLKEDLQEAIDDFAVQTQEAVDNWLDAHPEATTTVEDGSLTEAKFTEALKLKTINDYVTPEMYGAVGDGVSDDTQAFVDACQSGKTVFVENSAISDCAISGVEVICKKLIVKGTVTAKSLIISGSITIDGGEFVIDRTVDTGRDDSVFHDLEITIVNCDTLLTLMGTMFNFKFLNNTVKGKCAENVIKLTTTTWITYTIIKDSLLGTCDTPILIKDESSTKNMIADIFINNVYAQKYNAVTDCRFITTNSRGKLFVTNSFMYDISGNDTELYLDRDGSTTVFNIVFNNPITTSFLGKLVVLDSNGNYGKQLYQDVSNVPFDVYGHGMFPNKISVSDAFYELASGGYGFATDMAVTSENVIGTSYKVGKGMSGKSPDKFIGVNVSNNTLTVMYRDVDTQTWTKRTYLACENNFWADSKAVIDRYGGGVPIFYTPLHKLVVRYGSTYYDAMGNDITSSIT